MEDDWQNLAEDNVKLETPTQKVIPAAVNKWEGEDEDDDIKDSWDADDDEKKDEEKNETSAPVKPKKTRQQKIAEKEKLEEERENKRRKEREEEEMAGMTPEQRVAEILRKKQLEMEADTKLGLDSLGLGDEPGASTTQELSKYLEAIIKQIRTHNQEEIFPEIENFVKTLCAGLSSINIRKIRSSLDNLYLEKQKIEKGDKPKKKAAIKGKGKVLRMEAEDDYTSRAGAFEADDYDDFM